MKRVPVEIRVHRERTHECPKFVRKVKGSRYQLRIYVGPGKADSWNFGLFETCESALYARHKIVRLMREHTSPLELLAAARRAGVIPAGVLPRWVVRVPGGFACRLRGVAPDLPGPYRSPEAAYRAAAAVLRSLSC